MNAFLSPHASWAAVNWCVGTSASYLNITTPRLTLVPCSFPIIKKWAFHSLCMRRSSLPLKQAGQYISPEVPHVIFNSYSTAIMGPAGKRFPANRFSALDTELGSQYTAKGMTHDVYETHSGLGSPVVLSPASKTLGSSRKDPAGDANHLAGYERRPAGLKTTDIGSSRYSPRFLLHLRRDPSRKQDIPAIPIGADLSLDRRDAVPCVSPKPAAAHDDARTRMDTPMETVRDSIFPYAMLPFELRQIVLGELVPTRSIWNGTSFPKSCPERHQQAYFEKTKYLQNRALAH